MLAFSDAIINSSYINRIYNNGIPSHFNLSVRLKGRVGVIPLSNMYHDHTSLMILSNRRHELIMQESNRSVSFSKLNSNNWSSKLRNLPFNLMSECN